MEHDDQMTLLDAVIGDRAYVLVTWDDSDMAIQTNTHLDLQEAMLTDAREHIRGQIDLRDAGITDETEGVAF